MSARGFSRKLDPTTRQPFLEVHGTGSLLTDQPLLNKGTAFNELERAQLGLRGLLPPMITSIEQQMDRVMTNFHQKPDPLERYIHLMSLLDRNETLFYRTVLDHIDLALPVIYTPTVGEACQKFGQIYRRHRGLYLTLDDVHRVDEVLGNWVYDDVAVIVVTDGERILGLGDLGAGGMGISIGKSSLYVTGAGIHPAKMLPVCLDVGTNNPRLLDDPLYLGQRRPRERGPAYDALVEAFIEGVARRFPRAIVQFEDFGKLNAARLLERYRDRARCFNDDIQGTGAVASAGVLSALRISGQRLEDQRVLVVGGGSAGAGIAAMLEGAQIWVFDSKGLVTKDRARGELLAFARDEGPASLLEVAQRVKPTVLVGVSGQAGIFDQTLLATMDGPRPIVLPLSNPTANCECTPEQARAWTQGRAIVATGSPFPDTPQCNNLYIFPGVGLGTLVAQSPRVDLEMFRAAARTLADLAPAGQIYPPLADIRRVSRSIAKAVAQSAIGRGLAPAASDEVLEQRLDEEIWEPSYLPYRLAPR